MEGRIWAWGENDGGQLGDGTEVGRLLPVRVKDPSGTGALFRVTAIAAGALHSLAVGTSLVASLAAPLASGDYAVTVTLSGAGTFPVDGYYLSESPAPPLVSSSAWLADPPTTFTLSAGDGTKTLHGFVRDDHGHVSLAATADVILDTTPPPSGALELNDGALATTRTKVWVDITAPADERSGVDAIRFSNDGSTWGEWGGTSPDLLKQLPPGDGPRTLFMQARDRAGNISLPAADAIDLRQSIDGTFTGVSVNDTATFTNSSTVLLTMVAPAAMEYVGWVKVSNDGSLKGAVWEPYVTEKAWTIRTYGDQVITDVVYVQFRSADGQDTVSEIYSDDIVYDPNAPEYAPPPPDAPAAATRTTTVRLDTKAEDDRSGVAQMKLSNDPAFTDAQWEPYAASRAWPVNADAATTVYMRFRDTAGNESKTYTTILAKPALPAVPAQVAPVHNLGASTRPVFRWLPVTGAKTYEVQVAANERFAPLLPSGATAGTAWRPGKALPAGKTLYWRVRMSGGEWSPAWLFRTPLLDAPALASPKEGSLVMTLSPVLRWKKLPGATAYQVQVSTSPLFIEGYTTYASAKPSLVLPPLARKATYYWQVRGKKGKAWGAWSAIGRFETPAIAVPLLLRPRAGQTVKGLPVLLDWLDVPGAEQYRLQVCKDASCTKTYQRVDVAESLRLFEKLSRGAYWWRVAALGRRGVVGEWSVVRGFQR